MISVHKYPMTLESEFEVQIPEGADIFKVAMQDGFPYCWAIVDTSKDLVPHKFYTCKTGSELAVKSVSELNYIGTCDIHLGIDLGIHYFYRADWKITPVEFDENVEDTLKYIRQGGFTYSEMLRMHTALGQMINMHPGRYPR